MGASRLTGTGFIAGLCKLVSGRKLRRALKLRVHRIGGVAASPSQELYLLARRRMRIGDMTGAVSLLEKAIALDPTLDQVLEAQGELMDISGDSNAARSKYGAARALRARTRCATPDRSYVLRQCGSFTAEIAAYNLAAAVMKKRTLPLIAAGNAYLAERRPEKALVGYSNALRVRSGLPEALALKGEALSMMTRYGEAAVAFGAALAARPNDGETLNGRAIARLALGKVVEANADFRQQLELLAERVLARACVALRLADYEMARPYLEGAIEKEPTNSYWYLYLLAVRRRLGIPVETIEARSADIWPGPLLTLHAGRMSEDEVLKRADTDGRRAEANFQLGVIAVARDRNSAERYWQAVVDRAPPFLIEHAAARNELLRLHS